MELNMVSGEGRSKQCSSASEQSCRSECGKEIARRSQHQAAWVASEDGSLVHVAMVWVSYACPSIASWVDGLRRTKRGGAQRRGEIGVCMGERTPGKTDCKLDSGGQTHYLSIEQRCLYSETPLLRSERRGDHGSHGVCSWESEVK